MRQMRLKEAVETRAGVNHILHLEPRGGRQQGKVILFEAPYQLEASMHIVRSLLKWEESELVGREKRHINLNVLAKKQE